MTPFLHKNTPLFPLTASPSCGVYTHTESALRGSPSIPAPRSEASMVHSSGWRAACVSLAVALVLVGSPAFVVLDGGRRGRRRIAIIPSRNHEVKR
jgi:hypothetical protein